MKLAVGHVMKAVPRPKKSQCYWTKVDTCLLVLFQILVVVSVVLGFAFHGKHHHEGLGDSDSSSGSHSHSGSHSSSHSRSTSESNSEDNDFSESDIPHRGYRKARCIVQEMGAYPDDWIQCQQTEDGGWCDAALFHAELDHPGFDEQYMDESDDDDDDDDSNLPDWMRNIQEQIGDQLEEHRGLLNQLSDMLGDHMESAQEWIESLDGESTHDLLAQLMENPEMLEQLLEQNPVILEYLMESDWEMIQALCEQLPQVVERLFTQNEEWAQEFINKLREEHPDVLIQLQVTVPHLFPDDQTIPLEDTMDTEGSDDETEDWDEDWDSDEWDHHEWDEWDSESYDADWDTEWPDEDRFRRQVNAEFTGSFDTDEDDRRGPHRGHHGGHHGGHHRGHHGRGGHHGPPPGLDMGMPAPWGADSTGAGHMSPCMHVSVVWESRDGLELEETIPLHRDLETAKLFPQCSFATCDSEDYDENRKEVERQMDELREKMKEDEEFKCYVNREHPEFALLHDPDHHGHCHAWFWPALIAAILLAVLLVRRVYFSCCKSVVVAEKKVLPERLAPYSLVIPEMPIEEEKKPLDGPVVSAFPTMDMAPSNVYVPQTLYAVDGVRVDAPPAYHALDVTGLMATCPEEKVAPLEADVSAVHKYMLLQEKASNEANEKKETLA